MSIKDRVAIITGAGRGIGRATALRFAREGARVVLFSRTPAPLDDIATEIAEHKRDPYSLVEELVGSLEGPAHRGGAEARRDENVRAE